MAKDTYIPDWKSERDYDFCDELDGESWAWEFLRRNREYELQYDEAAKQELSDRQEHGKLSFPLTNATKHTLCYRPHKLPDEDIEAWILRCKDHYIEPRALTPLEDLAERWELTKAVPPDSPTADFENPFVPQIDTREINKYLEIEGGEKHPRKNYVMAAFRIDLPLKRQIDEMHSLLRLATGFEMDEGNYKMPSPPLQSHLWTQYIRLIDGNDADATWQEMFERIIPQEEQQKSGAHEPDYPRKLVAERLKAARKMTEQYIHCLNLDPVQKF